ncbi:hypothetical protein PVAP13_8KG394300 [Panicum virgatum]|uniref:Uncharacterized protein n=1 Tax=Panicum virgatum TaxID=38727 RepID=A0A8T0PP16_PANVG|nr:hypothetical protein PVAP13_8KG394300 [Panicum virgatum]
MALSASSTGLVMLCFASLLVSSLADDTSGALADAGKNMASGGVVDAYSPPGPPTYGPPTYGAVNRITARCVLVVFCCMFSFLF